MVLEEADVLMAVRYRMGLPVANHQRCCYSMYAAETSVFVARLQTLVHIDCCCENFGWLCRSSPGSRVFLRTGVAETTEVLANAPKYLLESSKLSYLLTWILAYAAIVDA